MDEAALLMVTFDSLDELFRTGEPFATAKPRAVEWPLTEDGHADSTVYRKLYRISGNDRRVASCTCTEPLPCLTARFGSWDNRMRHAAVDGYRVGPSAPHTRTGARLRNYPYAEHTNIN